jgi:hypothetical protein
VDTNKSPCHEEKSGQSSQEMDSKARQAGHIEHILLIFFPQHGLGFVIGGPKAIGSTG